MSNSSRQGGCAPSRQQHAVPGPPATGTIAANRGGRQLSIGPGTTALITGASGGIGEEFAIQLAARGAGLLLVARRAGKLEQLRAALLGRRPGLLIDLIAADLSEPGAAAEVARQVEASGRHVDVLINNAGVRLPRAVRPPDARSRCQPDPAQRRVGGRPDRAVPAADAEAKGASAGVAQVARCTPRHYPGTTVVAC
jgi:NAD(P)-dependent dehydrogenase (short-subunit alcohol dehydrogenase family)